MILYARLSNKFKNKKTGFVYSWFINFLILWIIARIAPYSGLGVVRFVWLMPTALVAAIFQAILGAPSKS